MFLVPTFSDGSPYPNINTNALFNGNGTRISAVSLFDALNSYQLNETAYQEMKPILLGPMFTLSYLAQFLTLSSLLTSVLIWNGSTIWYVCSINRNKGSRQRLRSIKKKKKRLTSTID
jgi:hypothetical protein